MRQEGLRARPRRRDRPKDGGQPHADSPNILDLSFVASAPNQKRIQRLIADHGSTCSISRSGNVWDNATADVSEYIERFCARRPDT